MKRKSSFRRDVYWLCERYLNKQRHTIAGQAACRLLAADPTAATVAQWLADLDVLLEKAWDTSPFGFYTSSLRAQGAALRIQQSLAEGVTEQMEGKVA